MKRIAFYLLALLLCLTACRSVKSEATDIRSAAVEIHDEMAISMDSASHTAADFAQWLAAQEQMDIEFTVYRPPDSTGRQSVLATGKAVRNKTQQTVAVNREETTTAKTANQQIKSELQQQEQTESHREKAKNSKFLNLKFVITTGLFLLLILIIYKYKKKWQS